MKNIISKNIFLRLIPPLQVCMLSIAIYTQMLIYMYKIIWMNIDSSSNSFCFIHFYYQREYPPSDASERRRLILFFHSDASELEHYSCWSSEIVIMNIIISFQTLIAITYLYIANPDTQYLILSVCILVSVSAIFHRMSRCRGISDVVPMQHHQP